MFGVTTTCVTQVSQLLEHDYDCLVFLATGTGGQSMSRLADKRNAGRRNRRHHHRSLRPPGRRRPLRRAGPFGAIARSGIPYVGSVGALDMVNFWAIDTVPERFRNRKLYKHNPNVTLMRTTAQECQRLAPGSRAS